MKLILYLVLTFQVACSNFFVDALKMEKPIPLFRTRKQREKRSFSKLDEMHMPEWVQPKLNKSIEGSEAKIPEDYESPDYRVDEPAFTGHPERYNIYYEFQRPIRLSPFAVRVYPWTGFHKFFIQTQNDEIPRLLGCYCTTVYRRFIPLAGCAVLTRRHVLTTASSTDLVLNKLKAQKKDNLTDLLGVWYDNNIYMWNSSQYAFPARIAHHAKYSRPHTVNISHPIPCAYDLSLWTMAFTLRPHSYTCSRGAPHWLEYKSSTPRNQDIAHIVGFQYVKAFKKVPMPWFKYVVRTKKHIVPCPKTEWGWFHCILGNWAKFGIESGAAWHRALQNRYWLHDGLIGMAAFSMHLRSEEICHYFTVINVHSVLDFIYDGYMGLAPLQFIDSRYRNMRLGDYGYDGYPEPKTYGLDDELAQKYNQDGDLSNIYGHDHYVFW